MKVRRNLLIALSLLSLGANAQRIKGSDTVLPVAQQTEERFMNQHPEARVTVTGGGTGVGISCLLYTSTDYFSMFLLMPILIVVSGGLSLFMSTILKQMDDFVLLAPIMKFMIRPVSYTHLPSSSPHQISQDTLD